MMIPSSGLISTPVAAQQPAQKPNILFIMGDDIGIMQPSIYHRGLMVGETPNIDRIGNEGAHLHDILCRAELHRRAQRLLHRHASAAHGHDTSATAGQPVLAAAWHPAVAKFLLDLGYNTGEFGKNHLGDNVEALPTAHGFQEFWGYLYHLDAMQGVSFPDINKSPTVQGIAPPCKNTPDPGPHRGPRCRGSSNSDMPDAAAAGACVQIIGRHRRQNQTCKDEGPLTLDRSTNRGRGNLGEGHRLSRSQRSRRRPTSRSSSGTTRRACTSRPCCRRNTRR